MASRKVERGFKKRTGLRSQNRNPLGKDEDDWETAVSSEEEAPLQRFEAEGAKPKTQQCQPGPAAEVGPSNTEVLTLFKDFITAQQRRDDLFKEELLGLQIQLEASRQPVLRPPSPGPSNAADGGRQRMDLPTPWTTRRGPTDNFNIGQSLSFSGRQENPQVGPTVLQSREPKMPVYQMGEDIENYLLRFERMAKTWQWPRGQWACRLIPLLTGKTLEAYTAMDEDKADSYQDLREALLDKFDIFPETYRQRFQATSGPPGETPMEALYRTWMWPERRSKEELAESIILEQLLLVLPTDTRTWVREHEPEDGLTAAKLAMQYLTARKGSTSRPARVDIRDFNRPRDSTPKVFEGNRGANDWGHTAQAGFQIWYAIIVSSENTKRPFAP